MKIVGMEFQELILKLSEKYTIFGYCTGALSFVYGILRLLKERTSWQRDVIAKEKEKIELNRLKML